MKTHTNPAHPQITDEEGLVALARRRKDDPAGEEALQLLIERYRLPLTSIARRCAWDVAYRDDLMQEAVIALVRAVDTYDEAKGPFTCWTRMWARGRCLRAGKAAGALRNVARFDQKEGVDPACIADDVEPLEDTVSDALDRRHAASQLAEALSYLPDELQAAAMSPNGTDRQARRTAEAMLRHPCLRSLVIGDNRERLGGASPTAVPVAQDPDRIVDGPKETTDCGVETLAPDPRGSWLNVAACHGVKVRTFFPKGPDRADAIAICGGCTVRSECLCDAIALPDRGGIRAGTTERDRRALKLRIDQTRPDNAVAATVVENPACER
jgi:WhiB family redox-sensing transcriptional regulator